MTSTDFSVFANNIVNAANRVLQELNDTDALQWHVERLEFLTRMYLYLEPVIGNTATISRVNELIDIKSRLESKIIGLKDMEPFSTHNLVIRLPSGGRPRLWLPEKLIRALREQGFNWNSIASLIGVSVATLGRRRKELKIPDDYQYSMITDAELDEIVREIKTVHPFAGQVLVMGSLCSKGFRVHRARVRESLHRVDPNGVIQRWQALIPRRQYHVSGPNALWHLDGNHKLIRYKFVIHGCIDGYSRLITYLACSTNNRAATVLGYFLAACDKWRNGPSRTRSDRGMENVEVERHMLQTRGLDRGSHICGPSVHNQRIERLWKDLNRVVGRLYLLIFRHLEEYYAFNVENERDLYCLHYVYQPHINRTLDAFTESWNEHGMRTESGRSPSQIWREGMIRNNWRHYRDIVDNTFRNNINYGIDLDGPVPNNVVRDNVVNVSPVSLILDENQYSQLAETVNPKLNDNNYGIDTFQQARQFVNHLLSINNQ